jgi:signal-transduction protein with cAMP-binding, CBS, and nucleotidyltransferase domain
MSSTSNNYFSQFCNCVPVNSIVKEGYDRLKEEVSFIEYNNNEAIFSIGDNDPFSLFLIQGDIEIFSKDGKKSTLSSEHRQSLFALSALKPRLFNAHATNHIIIAKINTKILNKLLIWEQSANNIQKIGLEVSDLTFSTDDGDIKWKMAMLKTQLFLTLPAANIMSLFDKMEVLKTKQNQQVITQGEPGDFYYIIKSGSCVVTHKYQDNAAKVAVNHLQENDSFGEEALISGAPRNANVTMKTDGILYRLDKDNFHSLLKEPLLNWVDKLEAKHLIQDGAIAIDVRMEDEFKHFGAKIMLNIPLYLIRLKISYLDKKKHYIIFCDNGARSSAAAFLMTQAGFKTVSVFKGGLQSK